MTNLIQETTAIVATYEREKALGDMLSSFWDAYPGLSFIVADNSYSQYPRKDVEYLSVEPGSGISLSRNCALDKVTTEFTLQVDDDHICLPSTDLERLLNILCSNDLDILAGNQLEPIEEQYYFHGIYMFEGRTLEHYVGAPVRPKQDAELYHVTPNFFIAKTARLKEVKWDANLRFAKEHDDFFLRAKEQGLRVSYIGDVEVFNSGLEKHHGGERGASCEQRFYEKWNIDDKWEIRWMKTPHPRLSFWSCRHGRLIEPSRAQFEKASSIFSDVFKDFEVLNPFE